MQRPFLTFGEGGATLKTETKEVIYCAAEDIATVPIQSSKPSANPSDIVQTIQRDWGYARDGP